MNGQVEATPARIFVGVKIAAEIARELAHLAVGLAPSSVRLVSPADIHLTLVPPWRETAVTQAAETLRGVASRFGPFTLTLQHAGYGPNPKRPHLLWVDCAPSVEIAALRAALLQAFGQKDERPFRPHITFVRLRGNGAALARRHPIDQNLSLTQCIEAIELFQSPPPGVRGYLALARAQLSGIAQSAENNDSSSQPGLV